MKKVFGIVGWSGCGKTDLTTRVISSLVKKKILVASLKHTHHNFQIDKEGKDSDKHLKSGANEVMIYNEKRWALFSAPQKNKTKIETVLEKFENDTEFVIIEGLKFSKFPKIEVIRSSLKKPFIHDTDKNIKAIVTDKEIKYLKTKKLPIFKFCETEKIANFIINYFKNDFPTL